MTVQITGNLAQAKALIERLRADKEKAVYVGFPTEFDEPVERAGNFNLASVAAVLEFGNEHIPSRPFLRQTLSENQEKYIALFTQLFKQGLQIERIYEQLALVAQGDVQLNIARGNWAPNAKSTIKQKGSSKPLIDTGKMRQSVKGIVK